MSLVSGPWFEDFEVGERFDDVPAVTVTEAHTVAYQGLFGDRSRLPLDYELCEQVTGRRGLVNNSLVGNIAIGASTVPSQRVLGNLFYRGLVFRQPVFVGDTLRVSTEVVALRQNRIKAGRAASGMVALAIDVFNQRDEQVMSFARCPMIPCRDPAADTGRADSFDGIAEGFDPAILRASIPDWDLGAYRSAVGGPHFSGIEAGSGYRIEARDTVTSAPELVRMTLNLAMTHTDVKRSAYAQRLVYGGHTISMAAAQILRAFPGMLSILGWHHCDHTGPVFEADILSTMVRAKSVEALDTGGGIAHLHVTVDAERSPDAPEPGSTVNVLDWELAALFA